MFEISVWTHGFLLAAGRLIFSFLFLWGFMDSTSPQDVGLPYMTDGRHAPDTLFLVAENDFRFRKEHCVSGRNWLEDVDSFVESHLAGPDIVDCWAMLNPAVPPETDDIVPSSDDELGGGSTTVEPDAHRRDKEEVRKEGASFCGFSQGKKFLEVHISEELNDLVRIATVAHRKGKVIKHLIL